MSEKWYVAMLLIVSHVSDSLATPMTCDEQIRVIRAENREIAFEKAVVLGKNEEHSYLNMNNEIVKWEFAGLIELAEIDDDDIQDGTEILSRIFKHDTPRSLLPRKEILSVFLSSTNLNE